MTDIVMRARVRATMLRAGGTKIKRIIRQPVSAYLTAVLLDEMADEIERLRGLARNAALEEVVQVADEDWSSWPAVTTVAAEIRTLKEED